MTARPEERPAPIEFASLWLSPHGRIGRRAYWIGLAPILVLLFGLSFVPVYGGVIGVLLVAYPYACIFAKRLHDLGRSGWFQVIFWVGEALLRFQEVRIAYVTLVEGAVAGETLNASLEGSAQLIGPMLAGLAIFSVFVSQLGLRPSRRGRNRYGVTPGEPGPEDVF